MSSRRRQAHPLPAPWRRGDWSRRAERRITVVIAVVFALTAVLFGGHLLAFILENL